jgi:hypothetical protein
MNKSYKFLIAFFLLFSFTALAETYTISGKVVDGSSGEALIGANVYLLGTSWGAASDADGNYSIVAEKGSYTITCSYIGYETIEQEISLMGDLTINFTLREYQFTLSVTVISDRAKDRETPVAFSNITKKDIQFNLGSRDIPLVLNSTPSVFATNNGGGAGDSRINLRGFSQRDFAIMINGIPLNDMENGWLYWSNWDGLGDVTSSIQIQRGLSAVTLATPSIGGTVNIITDPAQLQRGILYQNEIGTGGFSKNTLYANTGLVDGKWAMSFGGVRKVGDGFVDKTWTDAWAYYFGAAYQINNNNRLELYAMGAPQRHGQRSYKLNIATFSHELARDLGYEESWLADPRLREQGPLYSANWNGVSTSYTGMQWERSYWNNDLNQRYDATFIGERQNYFHKPLVNLNYYSQFAKDWSLYSTIYWSGGLGGGTGTFGRMQYNYDLLQRVPDWDATIASNLLNVVYDDPFNTGDSTYYVISTEQSGKPYSRGGILRNSVNNQWTIGGIAKTFWKATDDLNMSFGIDARYAEIEHYREVRDLLGNDLYYADDNAFERYDPSKSSMLYKKLGDRIDYNNTNKVNWFGGYVQGEYTNPKYTLYGNVALSTIKFDYTDHFNVNNPLDPTDISSGELMLETDWIMGYQFKGGASYRITNEWDVFANAGYVSKVPIFDQVINDVNGTKVEDPKNEKFLSFEAGVNARLDQNRVTMKLNGYFTNWMDRAQSINVVNADGSDGLIRLDGIDARHLGVEFEFGWQPVRCFRFDLATSYGNWTYVDDVSGSYIPDFSDPNSVVEYNYYIKDLKVGDAPQFQNSAGVTFFFLDGVQANATWRFYDNYYSAFDPFGRTDEEDREQVWQIPSYNLVDLHILYRLPVDLGGVNVSVFGHVFNLFDELYVEDATDNSSFNGYKNDEGEFYENHSASSAEVYLGLPRSFNAGFRVEF